MRYQLTEPVGKFHDPRKPRREVTVILRASQRDARAPLEFAGDQALADTILERLLTCYGYRGHFIEKETTPLDLDLAMASPPMHKFEPRRLEGAEVLHRKS